MLKIPWLTLFIYNHRSKITIQEMIEANKRRIITDLTTMLAFKNNSNIESSIILE